MRGSTDLTGLLPGQKLYTDTRDHGWSRAPRINHQIFTVVRVTKTQALCQVEGSTREHRFRLSDGRAIGENYCNAHLATPEILEKHEADQSANKAWHLASSRFSELERAVESRHKFTTEQMNALADTWERVKQSTQD